MLIDSYWPWPFIFRLTLFTLVSSYVIAFYNYAFNKARKVRIFSLLLSHSTFPLPCHPTRSLALMRLKKKKATEYLYVKLSHFYCVIKIQKELVNCTMVNSSSMMIKIYIPIFSDTLEQEWGGRYRGDQWNNPSGIIRLHRGESDTYSWLFPLMRFCLHLWPPPSPPQVHTHTSIF